MSADGNTIAIFPSMLLENCSTSPPPYRIQLNWSIHLYQRQLKLADDGSYMYFIHHSTGLVTKASLINTTPENPYIEVIDINNQACSV